jgi:hypothetical protein
MSHLESDYFLWLVSQIHCPRDRTYIELFERMHALDFVWTIPNDDNRVQDGLDLRTEFLGDSHEKMGGSELISILELLIALSRRIAFVAGGESHNWAWKLVKNLHLGKMSDPLTDDKLNRVEEILERLIWRNYAPNGEGGFFPLDHPREDQTKVELWYQMNAYVNEMN